MLILHILFVVFDTKENGYRIGKILGIIYIMTQRYKKPSESFGFLEKLYVLYYMKKLKTLSIYSFMNLFPDEASALSYIEKTLWGDLPICPRCKGTNTIKRPSRNAERILLLG